MVITTISTLFLKYRLLRLYSGRGDLFKVMKLSMYITIQAVFFILELFVDV